MLLVLFIEVCTNPEEEKSGLPPIISHLTFSICQASECNKSIGVLSFVWWFSPSGLLAPKPGLYYLHLSSLGKYILCGCCCRVSFGVLCVCRHQFACGQLVSCSSLANISSVIFKLDV